MTIMTTLKTKITITVSRPATLLLSSGLLFRSGRISPNKSRTCLGLKGGGGGGYTSTTNKCAVVEGKKIRDGIENIILGVGSGLEGVGVKGKVHTFDILAKSFYNRAFPKYACWSCNLQIRFL